MESFMKTKIASFLSIVALSLLTLATGSFAEEEEGFYEKDHVRGFISVGADYRGMRKEFANYVNNVAFQNFGHRVKYAVPDTTGNIDTVETTAYGTFKYDKFNDWYLGLHVNVGAQYKQFMTWIDFNFMPSQVSERKARGYTADITVANLPDGSYAVSDDYFPLYDVEWFAYGADWMFAWKLFGENAPINLSPAVGFGFNLINFHFASHFDHYEKGNEDHVETVRDRFYSTFATTVNSELELRIELGRLALGAYIGYRFIRYNDLDVEGFNIQYGAVKNGTDNVGDTYFLGVRATWYFLSQWEKKQQDKL